MIQTGRVTAEEGLRLLDALDRPARSPSRGVGRSQARRLKLLVSELGTGRRRTQINIPIALVELALRMAARSGNRTVRLAGREIDPETLFSAIRTGNHGLVLDLVDDEENIKVEVFLE